MNGFRLGSVFGFEIRIDYSWFVIFFLILWSLSAGYFPATVPDLSPAAYLTMGLVGTLLFFASLLAHELSHSVVARRRGIPVEGITLFIFGGMAHTRMESENPGDELRIAGVGPLTSIALGVLFFGLAWAGERLGWSVVATSVASYLSFINILLAVFNLLPGFPLDGGRLFRAAVWKATGDPDKATRWASTGGRWLGLALMVVGFFQAFAGAILGGLWLVFIGWFLRGAAETTLHQHVLRAALEGVSAWQVMSEHPETVSPRLTIQELVDDHLLRSRHESFPVTDDGRLEGLVTLDQVKRAPRARWSATKVAEIMTPRRDEIVVEPDAAMSEVLSRMGAAGAGHVLVARDQQLVGIISGRDVTEWARRSRELRGAP